MKKPAFYSEDPIIKELYGLDYLVFYKKGSQAVNQASKSSKLNKVKIYNKLDLEKLQYQPLNQPASRQALLTQIKKQLTFKYSAVRITGGSIVFSFKGHSKQIPFQINELSLHMEDLNQWMMNTIISHFDKKKSIQKELTRELLSQAPNVKQYPYYITVRIHGVDLDYDKPLFPVEKAGSQEIAPGLNIPLYQLSDPQLSIIERLDPGTLKSAQLSKELTSIVDQAQSYYLKWKPYTKCLNFISHLKVAFKPTILDGGKTLILDNSLITLELPNQKNYSKTHSHKVKKLLGYLP